MAANTRHARSHLPFPGCPRRRSCGRVLSAGLLTGVLLLLILPLAVQAESGFGRPVQIPLRAQLGCNPTVFSLGDTLEIVARRRFLLSAGKTVPLGLLTAAPDTALRRSHALQMMLQPSVHERSAIGRVVFGAGKLAGTGAALGGAGMVCGLWGEKTAGCLMGAGAVLGALWGGTIGSDNPGLRFGVEVEWDPGTSPVRRAMDPEERH